MCPGNSPVPNSAHRQAPMLDDCETNAPSYDTGSTVLSASGPTKTVELRFRPDQVRPGKTDNDTHSPKFASQGAVVQHQKITLSEASKLAFDILHQAESEREVARILEDYQNGDWKGVNDVIENMIRRQHRSGFDMREKAIASIIGEMRQLLTKLEIIIGEMQ